MIKAVVVLLGLILGSINYTVAQNNKTVESETSSDEKKSETFTVYGKCGMCKKRIETAAFTLRGVKKAAWDMKSKEMAVTFKKDKVSLDEIVYAITKAGHDTEYSSASDEDYENLHGCCKYQRPEKEKKN